MCDFSETRGKTALTLALSQQEREPEMSKALLPKEKGWDEGKLVAHRVKIPALLSFQAAALRSATPTPHDKA